jgi:hypothetical protein
VQDSKGAAAARCKWAAMSISGSEEADKVSGVGDWPVRTPARDELVIDGDSYDLDVPAVSERERAMMSADSASSFVRPISMVRIERNGAETADGRAAGQCGASDGMSVGDGDLKGKTQAAEGGTCDGRGGAAGQCGAPDDVGMGTVV